VRKAYREHHLAINPVYWLTSRDRLARWWQPIYLLLALLTIVGSAYYYEVGFLNPTVATCIILDLFLRLRIASLSGQHLAANRTSGALELILATPISVGEILRGHFLMLRRNFLPSLSFLWIMYPLLFMAYYHLGEHTEEGRSLLLVVFGAYLLSFIGDALALPIITLWKAMRMKNPLHGPGMAMLIVCFLPRLAYGVIVGLLHKWQIIWWQTSDTLVAAMLALGLWAVLVIPYGWFAYRNLQKWFRTAAADRENLPSVLRLLNERWKEHRRTKGLPATERDAVAL
jgi:hypothetical protein